MNNRVLVGVVALLAAGCSSSPTVSPESRDRINAILQEVSTRYAEDGASRCLSTVTYRKVEIIDEQRLIFRGIGDRAWLNELRRRCPGLRQRDTLSLELRDNRACEMDSVSVIDEFTLERTGPICILGNFKPIPPGHAALIDDLLHGKQ